MTPYDRLRDVIPASPQSLSELLGRDGSYAEAITPTRFVGEVKGWMWEANFASALNASKAQSSVVDFDNSISDHQHRILTGVGYRAVQNWEREFKGIRPGGIEPVDNRMINRCGFRQEARTDYVRALGAMSDVNSVYFAAVFNEASRLQWHGVVKRPQ